MRNGDCGRNEVRALAADNNVLSALKQNDLDAFTAEPRPGAASRRTRLYEPGDSVDYAYFPCRQSLVSYRVALPDGRGVETALIGREAAVGGSSARAGCPHARAVVQLEGQFLKVSSALPEHLKKTSSSLNHLFARYADCLIAQIFQATTCNATHSIEQRAAKWMLAALDCIGADEVPLTQEQLGGLLGVGRSYVSRVMRRFREDGVLKTRRGRVFIAGRTELEARSCRCNASVRDHFEEVLRGVYPVNGNETNRIGGKL